MPLAATAIHGITPRTADRHPRNHAAHGRPPSTESRRARPTAIRESRRADGPRAADGRHCISGTLCHKRRVGTLAGKHALILGVANERSIAWAISRALSAEGARCGLTYVGESLERRVRPLAESIGADVLGSCDVTRDAEIDDLLASVRSQWGRLDVLVHAIAFAQREDLMGRFVDTKRDGFRVALDISAYSLVALTRAALPLLAQTEGSVLTLTYAGSERVFPNYNVMGVAKAALESAVRYLAADVGPEGVRVNAISAGPIKTLSAAGIRGFREMLKVAEARAPLRRNVSADDVGRLAAAVVGPAGRGITGQVLYADAGLSILGA